MENSMIINGNNFNASNDFIYKKPTINSNGGKSVGIMNAHSKKSLLISTPLMLTWGVNEYTDEKTGKKTYDMAIQFPNDEYNTEQISKFLTALQNMESKIKADTIKNCKEWLNKQKISDEVIDALWTPMLKYPKDKESGDYDYSRSPTLKIKIPYWEGDFKMELYNDNEEIIFPLEDSGPIEDYISKGSNIATLIQCGGLWFVNGKFGITWKLIQGVVKPKPSLKGKCHIALSSEEKEKMNIQTQNDDSNDIKLIDDSDEDEVDDNEVTPEDNNEKQTINESNESANNETSVSESATTEKKKKLVRKKKSSD